MFRKLIPPALLVAGISLLSSAARAQCPEPTGVVNFVEINGEIVEGLEHEFFEDGWWEMWRNGEPVGWGTWELDPATCRIKYVNFSDDGGGNQEGTYEWNDDDKKWVRIHASHPGAPPLALVPPL